MEQTTGSSGAAALRLRLRLRHTDDGCVEVGLDEAGRGSLWGRLYVGAVAFSDEPDTAMFDHGAGLASLRDSKKLTPRRRLILRDYIREVALDHTVAFVEASDISASNVLEADLDCMHKALDALLVPVQRVLVDGDAWRPWVPRDDITGLRTGPAVESHLVVGGDNTYLPIAAASILAKTAHDDWVQEVVAEHPEWDQRYDLGRNQGYGTPAHLRGLTQYGATPLHRATFAPVRAVLGQRWEGVPHA